MSIDPHSQRESELLELNELLRGKVKQLEEKLWDTDQLRKVHSEKSFELEGKVRDLEAQNQKDFVWRGEEIGRLNDEGGWDGEIPIGWDTIKRIHEAAVEACALPVAPQQEAE